MEQQAEQAQGAAAEGGAAQDAAAATTQDAGATQQAEQAQGAAPAPEPEKPFYDGAYPVLVLVDKGADKIPVQVKDAAAMGELLTVHGAANLTVQP